jgi:hypothetical protein
MISALRMTPAVISFLLLGAHFFRSESLVLAGACALAPLLLPVKKRGVRFFLKALLFLGAVVWAQTAFILVQHRLAIGAPWLRLLAIMGGLVLFTLYAGTLLNPSPVGDDRNRGIPQSPPGDIGEK